MEREGAEVLQPLGILPATEQHLVHDNQQLQAAAPQQRDLLHAQQGIAIIKVKSEVVIYDYVDIHIPLCDSMYRKRLKG